MIGMIEAMLTDFSDEELKMMGFSDEDIDKAWRKLIHHDMANY